MTHTGNTGNAEIQGKYVEDCFASAGHDTGSTADIRVRACSFHNILNDQKRTASGNSTKDNEREQFNRNMNKRKEWFQNGKKERHETRSRKAVNSQIDTDQKEEFQQRFLNHFLHLQ